MVTSHLDKEKKKTKPISEIYILETPCVIYMKFGMWSTDGGGHFHSNNRMV